MSMADKYFDCQDDSGIDDDALNRLYSYSRHVIYLIFNNDGCYCAILQPNLYGILFNVQDSFVSGFCSKLIFIRVLGGILFNN